MATNSPCDIYRWCNNCKTHHWYTPVADPEVPGSVVERLAIEERIAALEADCASQSSRITDHLVHDLKVTTILSDRIFNLEHPRKGPV